MPEPMTPERAHREAVEDAVTYLEALGMPEAADSIRLLQPRRIYPDDVVEDARKEFEPAAPRTWVEGLYDMVGEMVEWLNRVLPVPEEPAKPEPFVKVYPRAEIHASVLYPDLRAAYLVVSPEGKRRPIAYSDNHTEEELHAIAIERVRQLRATQAVMELPREAHPWSPGGPGGACLTCGRLSHE